MLRQESAVVEHGTSVEILEAAILGVRVAAREYETQGVPRSMVRQLILGRLRDELRDDLNTWSYETLMATAARTLDHAYES